MKLTDYVADFLSKQGVKHVFGLTGGAVVHLFDSVARHPKMQPVFNHHEQAAALAAQAYARVTNYLGAAFVTTGPGGTNAITGLCAAWLDSIPCIYISGQTRLEHTTLNKPIRQLGTQQLDIINIVKSLTKYAVLIEDPKTIRYHLEKAAHIAKSGRPGPVWIDIPLNFQWASIEPDQLAGFSQEQIENSSAEIKNGVRDCLELLEKSQRPLILIGYGVRLARAESEIGQFIETIEVPFVSSWNASDIFPTNHTLYLGRPGIAGQRGANLAIQNCDLLICIGSHLSIPLTGTNFKAFARGAKKVMIDIDRVELEHRTVPVDLSIQVDAKQFVNEILSLKTLAKPSIDLWQKQCRKYKTYNAIPKEWFKEKRNINPYVFLDMLSEKLDKNDVIVVDGGGTVVYSSFQALKVKKGQRFILSSGLCAMGTGLPESVGACFANGKKRVICFCGDGSMQLNIQELQTIVHHKLPIKIFIFNNGGYLSIRHTQEGFLDSNFIGSQSNGGVSLPDYLKVAKAYGIKSLRIKNHKDFKQKINMILRSSGPFICELVMSRNQEVIPRLGFKKNPDGTHSPRPLEDMFPYLDRKEFAENMIVEPLPESKGL